MADLAANTAGLQSILETVNSLPSAGGSSGETLPSVTFVNNSSYKIICGAVQIDAGSTVTVSLSTLGSEIYQLIFILPSSSTSVTYSVMRNDTELNTVTISKDDVNFYFSMSGEVFDYILSLQVLHLSSSPFSKSVVLQDGDTIVIN